MLSRPTCPSPNSTFLGGRASTTAAISLSDSDRHRKSHLIHVLSRNRCDHRGKFISVPQTSFHAFYIAIGRLLFS